MDHAADACNAQSTLSPIILQSGGSLAASDNCVYPHFVLLTQQSSLH